MNDRVKIIVDESVLSKVISEFNLKVSKIDEKYLNCYDTFDYRLFNNFLTLYKKDNKFYKRILNSSEEKLVELNQFQDKISYILTPRVLLNSFNLRIETSKYKNTNGTFILNRYEVIKDKNSFIIANEVVAKYSKNIREILKILTKNRINEDIIELAISKIDPNLNYTQKDKPKLNIDEDANIAFKKILKRLLLTIKANENGVKESIDIEFLHDFRVAIRKSRAMLNYSSGALSEDKIIKFKRDLGYIAKITNEARDLDVYLFDVKEYQNKLAKIFQKDIEPLIEILKDRRKTEQDILINHLNSNKYKSILKNWEEFLNTTVIVNMDILTLAKEKLLEIYNIVIKKGKKITDYTKTEDMHKLRIEFKKFRYLLEFFSLILLNSSDKTQKELINEMLKSSKIVQNMLGNFQDLKVQQSKLQEYVKELFYKDENNLNTIMVLGKIFVDLKLKQNKIQNEFYSIFKKFYSKKDEFKELLI